MKRKGTVTIKDVFRIKNNESKLQSMLRFRKKTERISVPKVRGRPVQGKMLDKKNRLSRKDARREK